MKKGIKGILIAAAVVVAVLLVDTAQALLLQNSPFLKIRDYYDGGNVTYIDRGIFVTAYEYTDGTKEVLLCWNEPAYSPITDTTSDTESEELSDLDLFYSKTVVGSYTDLRELEESYDLEQAIADNCFVITGARVYSDDLYEKFVSNMQAGQPAFVRVVQPTAEGDVLLYDVMYDSEDDKIYLVTDTTRDSYASDDDRAITFNEYESATEYTYNGGLYWVAYRGTLTDAAFETDDVFIIAQIN